MTSRLSALTAITGGDIADGDLVEVLDISDPTMTGGVGTNKKATIAALVEAIVARLDLGGGGELSAAGILALLLTVDGPGSGLNADFLDGISASGFEPAGAASAAQAAAIAAAMALVDDLSGVTNASAARAALGLGTAATTAAAAYLSLVAGGAAVENIGAIESNVNAVGATGSTETLDTAVYGVHDCTMDQNCTFTFSNPAPSGKATLFTLILRGAFTPTFPASVDWPDGAAPTYSTPAIYTFMTVDAGTTWLGAQAGKAFA